MPIDQEGRNPVAPEAAREEELLQALFRMLPEIHQKEKLHETARLALKLMLRQPSDRELLDLLTAEIDDIVGQIQPASEHQMKTEVRQAAFACLRVLRSAKTRRLEPSRRAVANSAAGYDERVRMSSSHDDAQPRSRKGWLIAAAFAAAGAAALVFVPKTQPTGPTTVNTMPSPAPRPNALPPPPANPDVADEATLPLVKQMEAALHGTVAPRNVFGGGLNLMMRDGRMSVAADEIPPNECVSAAWQLSHKGLVLVDGQTPRRPSAIKFAELCHQKEEPATILWVPRQGG